MMRRKDKGTRQVVVFNYDTLDIWDLRGLLCLSPLNRKSTRRGH
jgi:hypothetical protein